MAGGPQEGGVRVVRLHGVRRGATEAAQVASLDAVDAVDDIAAVASAGADLTGLADVVGEVSRIVSFGPGPAAAETGDRSDARAGRVVAPVVVLRSDRMAAELAGAPLADLDGARRGAGRSTTRRDRPAHAAAKASNGAAPAGAVRDGAGRDRAGRDGAGSDDTGGMGAGAGSAKRVDSAPGRRRGKAGATDPEPLRDGTRRDGDRPSAGRRPRAGVDQGADPVAVAREICLRLLTDRSRTRHELAEALRRKGVPDGAADSVLERFDEVGLIDDAAFAGQWVRSRHATRGLARRAIAVELRRKGVDDEVAGEALAEVDAESEERRARDLVDRKLRSRTVDTAEQRATAARRLVGMLARRGYGGGVAYRVVREALAAHGADPDELGTAPTPD